VAAIGSRAALLLDAASYLASGAVIAVCMKWRAPARSAGRTVRASAGHVFDAVGTVLRTPVLRTLVALGSLSGLLIVPEGLAAPYAAAEGAGPAAVGVLLTGLPAGTAVGAAVLARWLPGHRRVAAIELMAALAGPPLLVLFFRPAIPATVGLLFVVGACGAYQVLASTMFVRAVPAGFRGAALGFAGSVVVASQGVGVLAFGIVADVTGPARAAGIAGLAATCAGVLLAADLRRVRGGIEPLDATAPASG
jgi:hypothetical protein